VMFLFVVRFWLFSWYHPGVEFRSMGSWMRQDETCKWRDGKP
jgi:hypothetical protein